ESNATLASRCPFRGVRKVPDVLRRARAHENETRKKRSVENNGRPSGANAQTPLQVKIPILPASYRCGSVPRTKTTSAVRHHPPPPPPPPHTPPTSPSAAAARSFLGFIDLEGATIQFFAVPLGHGRCRVRWTRHLDKRKTTRLTGLTVGYQLDFRDLATSL